MGWRFYCFHTLTVLNQITKIYDDMQSEVTVFQVFLRNNNFLALIFAEKKENLTADLISTEQSFIKQLTEEDIRALFE